MSRRLNDQNNWRVRNCNHINTYSHGNYIKNQDVVWELCLLPVLLSSWINLTLNCSHLGRYQTVTEWFKRFTVTSLKFLIYVSKRGYFRMDFPGFCVLYTIIWKAIQICIPCLGLCMNVILNLNIQNKRYHSWSWIITFKTHTFQPQTLHPEN